MLSIIVVSKRESAVTPESITCGDNKAGFKCIKCDTPVVLGLMGQVAYDNYAAYVKLVCEECVPTFPKFQARG